MTRLSRRDLLQAAAVAGIGSALGQSQIAMSQETSKAATGTLYKVKPLPFNAAKLKGISERLIVSHHEKNYAGAVKRLSVIQDQIRQLPEDAASFQLGSLKREELIAMNSMTLHEFYFGNLGGDGRASGAVTRLIKDSCGSMEAWEHEFRLTGKSLSGGSGWVMLVYSPHDRKAHNVWSSDHQVNLVGGVPLLVMDMYEHSYQMDYGADAKGYINAFFANINWQEVDRRVEQLLSYAGAE